MRDGRHIPREYRPNPHWPLSHDPAGQGYYGVGEPPQLGRVLKRIIIVVACVILASYYFQNEIRVFLGG